MINNLVYIFILLPLIASLMVNVSISVKWVINSICCAVFFILFSIAIMLSIEISEVASISSNVSFGNVPLGMEFKINQISLMFIFIFLILKFNQIFQIDRMSFNFQDNKQYQSYVALRFASLFAIIGAVLSNNIFNILVFLEIFIVTNIAVLILTEDEKINKFCIFFLKINVVGTMLLLMIFSFIFFSVRSGSLDEVSANFSNNIDSVSYKILIIAIILTYFFKLFLFWFLNIKNIKNFPTFLSQLYNVVFINANIAIFLMIKFFDILTTYSNISIILSIVMIMLICYCSLKLIFTKQMRLQISLICAMVFLLAISSLLMRSGQSIMSLFFYIAILNTVILVIFNVFYFISVNYKVNNVYDFSLLRSDHGIFLRLLSYLFVFLLAVIFPLPHSPTFFANFFLTSAIFENNDLQLYEYTNLLDPYYLIAILSFQLSMMFFCYRYAAQLLSQKNNSKVFNVAAIRVDPWFIVINFMLLVVILRFSLDLEAFNYFAKKARLILLS